MIKNVKIHIYHARNRSNPLQGKLLNSEWTLLSHINPSSPNENFCKIEWAYCQQNVLLKEQCKSSQWKKNGVLEMAKIGESVGERIGSIDLEPSQWPTPFSMTINNLAFDVEHIY